MNGADPGRSTLPRLPILTYHAVSDGAAPICLSASRLREHLASLSAGGWHVLTLDAVLAGYARGVWPQRSVMLTFDDGLASFADRALPLLGQLGLPATLFVVAGRLGDAADWPGWPRRALAERLLDAGALREASAAGVEVGAHSMSHARLSRLPRDGVAREILDSRARLEDILGRAVRVFAYPFGDAPDSATRLVRDHFSAGFGTRLAYVTGSSRIELLERIDAHYLRHRPSLTDLDAATTRAYLSVRGLLAALRRSVRAGPGSFQAESNRSPRLAPANPRRGRRHAARRCRSRR